MAASINYPSALDTDATVGGGNEPDGTTALDATDSGHPKHSVLHQNIGEAIQQIQTKVGKTSSTPSANTVLASSGTGDSAWTATPTVTTLTATNLGGTLSDAAQTNITSVGTLTSLTVSGVLDANGVVKITDGSVGTPALTFDSDENTGVYKAGADQLAFTAGGVNTFQVINNGVYVPGTSGANNYYAQDPATGTGNDAEWAATGFATFVLKRNSSLTAEKENITDDLSTHLTADMIDSVVPKMWNRINSPGYPEIGPLAEDMEAISPFLAAHGADIRDGTYKHFLTGINKTAYLSLLVLAVKDLRTQVADLTTRLQALEG